MIRERLSQVLLIEDNPGDRRLIEEMLRDAAGRVPAGTGRGVAAGSRGTSGPPTVHHADRLDEGLQQLDDGAIDVVLLDLALPDSTGLDTLTAVLEHPADVPVVVLTGLSDERVGVRAVQHGAQSYLLKDEISGELLIRSLHHALERHERETRLTSLTTVSGGLMAAPSDDAIAESTIEAAADVLDLPVAVVCLYDPARGALHPAAASDQGAALLFVDDPEAGDTGIDADLTEVAATTVRRAFAADRPIVDTDGSSGEALTGEDGPLESLLVLPLGTHGVLLAGTVDGTMPSTSVDFARILATNAEAALERLEREREVREREATLDAKNEALERLDRINTVIRDIAQGVVRASTRTQLERTVCERLATVDHVRFVWIGTYDELTGTFAARASAGAEDGYLASVGITTEDGPAVAGPVETAVRTREVQVVADVVRDLPSGPDREEALKRDVRTFASIPLVHGETLYGVLTVYVDRPGFFTGDVQTVLGELGEVIAHAINAVESKRALISDRVVELEFELRSPEVALVELSAQVDCGVTFRSVVPRDDDRLRIFFSTRGAEVEEVLAYADRALAIEECSLVDDGGDSAVFECTLREPNVVSFCLDHGVGLQALAAERGEGRVVVELSSDADVRGFAARFQSKYPETTLVASREGERSVQTRQAFESALNERLTDRQAEVLRTAFLSGYFDSPRASSGREVAEMLGIAQPTFNHHLRAAQRKLLGLLYAE